MSILFHILMLLASFIAMLASSFICHLTIRNSLFFLADRWRNNIAGFLTGIVVSMFCMYCGKLVFTSHFGKNAFTLMPFLICALPLIGAVQSRLSMNKKSKEYAKNMQLGLINIITQEDAFEFMSMTQLAHFSSAIGLIIGWGISFIILVGL